MTSLLANAGLPMLMIGLPVMVMLLVPIACIEAAWYKTFLPVSWKRACLGSLKANCWSTFAGLPVTWLIWTMAGLMSLGIVAATKSISLETFVDSYVIGFLYLVATSGWLVPVQGDGMEVVILGAGLVLLLPAYLASYLLEARMLQRGWVELDRTQVYRQVWLAHVCSYGLLYLVGIYRFCAMAYHH